MTDGDVSWPPPDPDRMQRFQSPSSERPFTRDEDSLPDQDWVIAFRQRQQEDLKRFEHGPSILQERQPSNERNQYKRRWDERFDHVMPESEDSDEAGRDWRDSEGDRLEDFGVDEDVEFYDEDNVPLAQLLRRRRGKD